MNINVYIYIYIYNPKYTYNINTYIHIDIYLLTIFKVNNYIYIYIYIYFLIAICFLVHTRGTAYYVPTPVPPWWSSWGKYVCASCSWWPTQELAFRYFSQCPKKGPPKGNMQGDIIGL